MLRRALVAVAAIVAILVLPATAAQAIPPGENLIVFAYFDGPAKQHLVGQAWSGCGQPSGSWGTTSAYRTLYFTPC